MKQEIRRQLPEFAAAEAVIEREEKSELGSQE